MSKTNLSGPCLIARLGSNLPNCHEYDFCSCDLNDHIAPFMARAGVLEEESRGNFEAAAKWQQQAIEQQERANDAEVELTDARAQIKLADELADACDNEPNCRYAEIRDAVEKYRQARKPPTQREDAVGADGSEG